MFFVQQWSHNSAARRKMSMTLKKKNNYRRNECSIEENLAEKRQLLPAQMKSNMGKSNLQLSIVTCLLFVIPIYTYPTLFLTWYLYIWYNILQLNCKQKWYYKHSRYNAPQHFYILCCLYNNEVTTAQPEEKMSMTLKRRYVPKSCIWMHNHPSRSYVVCTTMKSQQRSQE